MRRLAALIPALLLSASLSASPETWSRFRGPNGSGIAIGGKPLPAEIDPDKNVIWKTALPAGHSSPILHGRRIYLTAERDGKLLTLALDASSGAILWEKTAPYKSLDRIHSIGSHAQPTVATDGERVVSLFGSCGLFCYSASGSLLWHEPMGPFNDDWGAGSSPVIVEGRVIVSQDHDTDSFLAAFDLKTGKLIWRTERPGPRSYATPIVWRSAGESQLVVPGTLQATGYDLASGKQVWVVRGLARITNPTAVVGGDGTLYLAAWAPGADPGERIQAPTFEEFARDHDKDKSGVLEIEEIPADSAMGRRFRQIDRNKDNKITRVEYEGMRQIFVGASNVVMAVRPGGKGDITETHVKWTNPRGVPYVPSPLYHNGLVFVVKNGGIVSCFDADSGELVKMGRVSGLGNYYASPVLGDGKIYLISERGDATVITAEKNWKVLSTASFAEDTYATPALVDGRIYLRTTGHLYCFGR